MMIRNAQHRGGIHALRGLGQIGEIHQIHFFARHVVDDLRRGKTEFFEHEFGLRGRRALSGRGDVKTAFAVQISGGDRGNDAVGIGIHMTKNECGHDMTPSGMILK